MDNLKAKYYSKSVNYHYTTKIPQFAFYITPCPSFPDSGIPVVSLSRLHIVSMYARLNPQSPFSVNDPGFCHDGSTSASIFCDLRMVITTSSASNLCRRVLSFRGTSTRNDSASMDATSLVICGVDVWIKDPAGRVSV